MRDNAAKFFKHEFQEQQTGAISEEGRKIQQNKKNTRKDGDRDHSIDRLKHQWCRLLSLLRLKYKTTVGSFS